MNIGQMGEMISFSSTLTTVSSDVRCMEYDSGKIYLKIERDYATGEIDNDTSCWFGLSTTDGVNHKFVVSLVGTVSALSIVPVA